MKKKVFKPYEVEYFANAISNYKDPLLFRQLKMVRKFLFGSVLVFSFSFFSFFFHAKSVTTNNDWTGLRYISPHSHDSNNA